jgi:hypothetical protein
MTLILEIWALHLEGKYSHLQRPSTTFHRAWLGCIHPYGRLPSLVGLFEKFWSKTLQRRIGQETNRYASEIIDDEECRTRGGLDWTPLGVAEFRTYLAICLFMGVKKLPSIRLYWSRENMLLHCPIIS